tara:strand:- start:11449 stop:12723 length:1275 start_codon:yes stop_codon:yes gene_type:complete
MKFKKYTFVILILCFFPTLLVAQSEQLQREIRIAEGILNELFSENLQGEAPFISLTGNRITSDYIPGYGVHFVIGDRLLSSNIRVSGRMEVVRTDRDRRVIEMRDRDGDDSDSKITQESIEEKIHEYLIDYAPLMQSLPENEYIRVTTGPRAQLNQVFVSLTVGERSFDFPKITKWASVRDLQQLRTGQISEQQFLNRVQSADLSEISETREYNIFNSILKSSVSSADFEYLRVRDGAPYIYLPGLGVQFNLNVRSPGSGILSFIGSAANAPDMDFDFNFDMDIQSPASIAEASVNGDKLDSIRREMAISREEIDSIRVSAERSMDSLKVVLDDFSVSFGELFNENEAPDPEELEREKELLYDEIVRTMKEYGSTLSSLPDNEMLIISVHWSGRNTELPQRTYLRIRKSDLSSSEPFIQEISRR